MKKFSENYQAYYEFLRADNFPPSLNELGNLFTTLLVFVFFKYLGLFEAGVALAIVWFIRQRVEAYRVGAEWLRTGKDVRKTKQFVVGKFFAKFV